MLAGSYRSSTGVVMPNKLKLKSEAHIKAGVQLRTLREGLSLSAEEFRCSLNETISSVAASVGLSPPKEISKDMYSNYEIGVSRIPFHVDYAAKLVETKRDNPSNTISTTRKLERPVLNVFDNPIDKDRLTGIFQSHQGQYICFYYVKRLVLVDEIELPCLYAIHYDINDYDKQDGTLIAEFTTERPEQAPDLEEHGASEKARYRGYAKLLIAPENPNLIYLLHIEQDRKQPPTSGLLRASPLKTEHSFFYGIASGFRSLHDDTIISVRVLWIPRITQKLGQLSYQITERDIGKRAWNGIMRFWAHKESLEDLYLLAPSMLHGQDGKGNMSMRGVAQYFINSMGDKS
jgi:hypothetical protein